MRRWLTHTHGIGKSSRDVSKRRRYTHGIGYKGTAVRQKGRYTHVTSSKNGDTSWNYSDGTEFVIIYVIFEKIIVFHKIINIFAKKRCGKDSGRKLKTNIYDYLVDIT